MRGVWSSCWIGVLVLPLLWACGNVVEVTPEPTKRLETAKLEAPPDPGSRPPSTRPNSNQCPEIASPDWAGMRELRDAGRYLELEALLTRYDEAYSRNVYCEGHVWSAYDGVASDGDHGREQLDRWVEARPEAPIPLIVRASQRVDAGYEARGTKLAKDTPSEKFQKMREYFEQAAADAVAAAKLDGPHLYSVGAIIRISRATGNKDWAQAWVDTYSEKDPLNYGVRRRLIEAYYPRWGGSLAKMERIARDAQRYTDDNPRLRVLMGFHHAYTAREAFWKEDWEQAIAKYSKALEYGDYGTRWSVQRAKAYNRTGRLKLAHADIAYAKLSVPNDAETWTVSGELYIKRGNWQAAIVELDRAIEISPRYGRAHRTRGFANEELGRWEKAVEDYRVSLQRDPNDVWTASHLGAVLFEQLDRADEAIELLRLVVDLEPTDHDHWFRFAQAQEAIDDPDATQSYTRFLTLADPNDKRDSIRMNIARRFLDPSLQAKAASAEPQDAPNRMPGMSLIDR